MTVKTAVSTNELKQSTQKLYNACKMNEQDLHAASEQMQNLGLKVLFKRFAQQLHQFADELNDIAEQMKVTLSDPGRANNAIQRGWSDIRIGMIVGRANRQHAAAVTSKELIDDLITLYDQELQVLLPEFARVAVQQQRDKLQQIEQWLQRISARDKWIVRLYDDADQADHAVKQLKRTGFSESQIKLDPLHELPLYREDNEERVHSTVDAAMTGALLGAIIGAIVGIIAGYAIPIFSQTVPATQAIVWGSIWRSGLIGMAVGASFFSLFGFLLGQGISEDDESLSQSLMGSDAVVVSVQTSTSNHTDAAKILQMWHERTVENVPI